jgi:cardiolipin synthase
LLDAAKRNVKVNLLLDGFGSKNFDKKYIQQLVDAGVEFRFFSPLFSGKNLSIGRRLHHKVVVFDHKIALVGGINIADKYNEVNNKLAWLDYAILTEGNVVHDILKRCIELHQKKYINQENIPFDFTTEFNVPVKLNINDYLRGKKEISRSYKDAFGRASNSIIIMGSYFIPGRGIRKRLRRASKNGVSVKLILTKYSDVWLAGAATRYLYNWLLKNDIEIYEWKNSVLHAKVAVVDEEWFTIGSHNLNFLSDYESIEMNLEVLNKKFGKEFSNQLLEILNNNCDKITYTDFKKIPFIYRVFYRFAYYILRYTWRFFYSFRKIENLQTS